MRLASAGEMAAALAHELNQPLTAVASYARASRTIARERPGEAALLSDTLEKLLAESSRAAEVVRRLRDFFRTGALQLAPLDLAEAARQCLENARTRADGAGVALRLGHAAGSRVLADRVQIEIVLRNLVANALEAARDGPAPREVGIEIAADEERVTLTIADSGGGVLPGEEERIFEPFETTRPSGMGMGLAISRAVVEAHGGRLWAEAGPHGRFHLSLPGAASGHE
jgi:C4-dicarboxylate-specific signal transduction histidine kinase